jgi:C-terminal processing protease CtpA/Prc
MLLALYDLLGDNIVYGGLDINKKLTHKIKLENGKYLDNNEVISFINPKGKKIDKLKVALITNIITASSGEITAMSFKGRKNTFFIGEPTYGFTTSNDKKELPFGAYMAFMVAYDCDRNGTFYEKIIPDIKVSKQDNFDNLILDRNVQEAIKWMNKK